MNDNLRTAYKASVIGLAVIAFVLEMPVYGHNAQLSGGLAFEQLAVVALLCVAVVLSVFRP